METTLATIPATTGEFRQLTTPKGNPGKKVLEFLGEGIKSISAGRKILRGQGVSAKVARDMINAALKGDHARVAKLKAQAFFSDSIEQGFVPTIAEESASGKARTLKLELPSARGAKDNTAALLAKKNAEIESQKAENDELKARLAALEAAALPAPTE